MLRKSLSPNGVLNAMQGVRKKMMEKLVGITLNIQLKEVLFSGHPVYFIFFGMKIT